MLIYVQIYQLLSNELFPGETLQFLSLKHIFKMCDLKGRDFMGKLHADALNED